MRGKLPGWWCAACGEIHDLPVLCHVKWGEYPHPIDLGCSTAAKCQRRPAVLTCPVLCGRVDGGKVCQKGGRACGWVPRWGALAYRDSESCCHACSVVPRQWNRIGRNFPLPGSKLSSPSRDAGTDCRNTTSTRQPPSSGGKHTPSV